MDDAFAIQVNSQVQEIFRLKGYRDLDRFGIRLSRSVAKHVGAGESFSSAIQKALAGSRTAFFRLNRGVSREDLQQHLSERIQPHVLPSGDLLDSVRDFRRFAERQLGQELWKARNDEAVLRSHLQTFLEARHGRTLKEMVTGRGRTDVTVLRESHEVIETKVWHGIENHNQGLRELSEYLRTEDLRTGYYVELVTSSNNVLLKERGNDWSEELNGKTIHVLLVYVSEETPSETKR